MTPTRERWCGSFRGCRPNPGRASSTRRGSIGAKGRFQTETKIEFAGEDRASVDNRVVTFLTALPEDVANRDVFGPGSTARDAVGLLLDIVRWLANAAIVLVIVAGPFVAVGFLVRLGVRAIKRRRAQPEADA